MGSDDTDTTFEDDLDLDDDTDADDDDFVLGGDDDGGDGAAAIKRQEKVKKAIDKERQQAQQREAALMGSLKEAWGADAMAQYPLADVAGIGLTGIDAAAKEKFLTEVKAQHEAREHALAQAGYVRLDGDGKPIERPEVADGGKPTPTVGSAIEAERQAAAGWGKPLTGTDAQHNVRAEQEREVMETMKQGPLAVAKLMVERGGQSFVDFASKRR